jgi:hypothetical protein
MSPLVAPVFEFAYTGNRHSSVKIKEVSPWNG